MALKSLDSVANNLYEAAVQVHERGEKQNELKLYEQVLIYNPNHFSALFKLAEGYLSSKDFSKAVKAYTRAYQVDPIRHQQGFVQALLSYGKQLWSKQKQQNWRLAKEQFTRVKKIEPENQIAKEKLLEIEAFESKKHRGIPLNIIAAAAIVVIPTLVASGYYLGNRCPQGQKKLDGICEVPFQERFSRGERTLFPSKSNNLDRNLAIKAFKQGDYSKSVKLFKKALVAPAENGIANEPEESGEEQSDN